MKTLCYALAGALLCCTPQAFAASAETESSASSQPATDQRKPEVWVNLGGFSRHFARDKGYNETNLGLGLEYRTSPEVSFMAGTYYNSMRKTTYYAAVNWQPLSIGPWKVGASAGVMNGYPAVSRGGTFFAALPMATYEGKRFGVNLGLIPSIGKVDGAVIFQFKLRVD
jgi:hypothetical protein